MQATCAGVDRVNQLTHDVVENISGETDAFYELTEGDHPLLRINLRY